MRIQHLIDGRQVGGRDYFETLNPATQEVLAEVAAGGAAEVNAAVAAARAADNFYYFAEMCSRVDGHTYPTPTHQNYTLFHPVGVRVDLAVEPALHDGHREDRALPGVRQHGGAEDERAVEPPLASASCAARG